MPDYMFLLESRLMPEQRATMMRVQELSAALGLNVYLTGGTVRDLITGATLRDLDFTVEGNPTKIARELETTSRRRYVSPYGLAQIYAALNSREDTFKWLQAAAYRNFVRGRMRRKYFRGARRPLCSARDAA